MTTSAAAPAAPGMTATACPDCGGPMVRAFTTTDAYDRCRRCGHVFAADVVFGAEQVDR